MMSASEPLTPTQRILAIDSMRVLAILGVIFIHTKPFVSAHYALTNYALLGELLQQLALSAVPFFFAAAGYLFVRKLSLSTESTCFMARYMKRIAWLYAAWWTIYFFISPNWLVPLFQGDVRPIYWHLTDQLAALTSSPMFYMLRGTRMHLWFLSALFIAMALYSVFIRFRRKLAFLLLAAALYGIGLLMEAYASSPAAVSIKPHLALALLYAPLFVALGGWLAMYSPPLPRAAWLCVVGGFALQLAEAHWLTGPSNGVFTNFSYYLGTVPLGCGILMLALAYPRFGAATLAPVGGLVLGVYLIHLLVKDALTVFGAHLGGDAWEVGFPLLIFAISLAIAKFLTHTRFAALIR